MSSQIMGIHYALRHIFVHIPKNGGTSVDLAWGYRHLCGHRSVRGFELRVNLKRYFVYTVLRNPYERAVSNYLYSRKSESHWHSITGRGQMEPHPDYSLLASATFREYCQMLAQGALRGFGTVPQIDFLTSREGRLRLDHAFVLDYINEDFTAFFRKNYRQEIILPQANQSHWELPLRAWYDPECRDLIARLYQEDLRLYWACRRQRESPSYRPGTPIVPKGAVPATHLPVAMQGAVF